MAKQNEIPIIFICDDNYACPTAVAITSLIQNRNTSTYKVYVLGVDLSEDSVRRISSLSDKSVSIEVRQVELSERQKEVKAIRERVTLAALLKFDLPLMFQQYDKLIYIDSDVIISKDLADLYSIPLQTEYAAVVKDTITVRGRDKHLKTIDFKLESYFNSGVLLLNTKKMREDDIPNKLLEYRINGKNHFMDQDALNVVFNGNVKYISPYFNCLNCFFEWQSIDELSDFYGVRFPRVNELVFLKAYIIHCGDKKKPWIYDIGFLTELYNAYYMASPYSDIPFAPVDYRDELQDSYLSELEAIRQSISFRIGRIITWLPRKLRDELMVTGIIGRKHHA